jgi:hypothetical protein
MVVDVYLGKLMPFIHENESAPKDAPSASPPACAKCQEFYPRLGIPSGATKAEIKQIYRDLCTVWHPDHFEHNERLKEKATKEFQKMQQEFDHIDSHIATKG